MEKEQLLEQILKTNEEFVTEKNYEKHLAEKFPKKKLAVLTCMDTRLVKLLPEALGVENGDIVVIKNAGGVVSKPYGDVVRSLLVAILELGVTGIMVIGHTDCGVQNMSGKEMIHLMTERGVKEETIRDLKYSGLNFDEWLCGFDTNEQSVRKTMDTLEQNPLLPKDVWVEGFVMDTVTGKLTAVPKAAN